MSVQISASIDEKTKKRFDKICSDIGISPSGALSVFIKGVINHNGIPFTVAAPQKKTDKMPREDVFGCMRGQFMMTEDFNAPLEELREYME
ncbi:MAG: type II toxin-antitoxin system RelB/DinJ family antitoxin [Oscillospiraceae bacterium]|nr:type II toxin-antitoxin system RelB/DinJ family antitoxin [Oscillospiraceae bacterium]